MSFLAQLTVTSGFLATLAGRKEHNRMKVIQAAQLKANKQKPFS